MKQYLSIIFAVILMVFLAACPLTDPDPGPGPDPDPDPEETFSWSNPKAPDGVSVFDVSELVVDARTRFFSDARWIAEAPEGSWKSITPDNVNVAYRYIALVPEDIIEDMAIDGFYGVKTGGDGSEEDWSSADITEYLSDSALSEIPGFNSSHNVNDPFTAENVDGRNISFVGYVGSNTPTTSSDIKTNPNNFVIFDGSLEDELIKVFDLADDSFAIEVEEGRVPSEGVVYCGIAYELVYYEAEIDGYGLIRHYYNDLEETFGSVKAGDMLVKLEISHPDYDASHAWQWVYLKHGDGPDSLTGTVSVPTVVGGYDNVDVSGTPTSYDGYFALNGDDIPVFMSSGNTFGWWDGTWIPKNSDKRPSGTGPYVYWMATNFMMNGPAETQYTNPDIDLDTNPGGFKVYDGDDDGNPIDSTPISFGGDGNEVICGGDGDNQAYLIYYETDDHLGAGDVSTLQYESSRLGDDKIISRQKMADNFGEYAYDSGLITQVYDDSPMIKHNRDSITYDKYPTLLDLSMGRLCVIGNRREAVEGHSVGYVYNPPDPTSPDALYESIVKVDINLEINVNMRFGVDCVERAWAEGTAVTESDFSRRFMEFIPNWGAAPNGPVPAQQGFDGVGVDDPRLNTDLSFRMDKFDIQARNVLYGDVYSYNPKLTPDPAEGPFSTGDGSISVTVNSDHGDRSVAYYYTLDGTDPVPPSRVISSTTLYTGGINIGTADSRLKIIAVEEGREPSKIIDARYVFEEAGGTSFTVTISNSPAADGNDVFVGLFADEDLNIDQEINPVYSEVGTLSGSGVICTFENVEAGTYYLAAIADVDDNMKISKDDLLYPNQSRADTLDTIVSLSSSSVSIPPESSFSINTTSWYTIP